MKRMLFAAVLCLVAAPIFAAEASVSVKIGDPNFFGHITVGKTAKPAVIFHDPVVIKKSLKKEQPIYLRVRPGHEKNWRKHCHEYKACGRPVYFVKDSWYKRHYTKHYHREDMRHDRRQDRRDEADNRSRERNDARKKDFR